MTLNLRCIYSPEDQRANGACAKCPISSLPVKWSRTLKFQCQDHRRSVLTLKNAWSTRQFLKHFLELKSEALRRSHRPKLVKVSDIASSLNNVLTEDQIRSKLRLKICAPVRSSEGISKEDYALNPEYRFEHEKEIQKMCTPEDICNIGRIHASRHHRTHAKPNAGTSETNEQTFSR